MLLITRLQPLFLFYGILIFKHAPGPFGPLLAHPLYMFLWLYSYYTSNITLTIFFSGLILFSCALCSIIPHHLFTTNETEWMK